MGTQHLDTLRGEGMGRQAAHPRVRGSVQKKHLFHHDLRNWIESAQSHFGKLLRRRRTCGRVMVKNGYNIVVSSHDPGVYERIPVHWILTSESMKQWVWIRENLWVKEMVKTQSAVC